MRRLLLVVGLLGVGSLCRGDAPSAGPAVISRPGLFKALVNPNCSHCRDEAKRRAGDLRDDDRVLCWIRGYSDGGAIPFRFFLVPYRVISDTYGVFVYDPDAGFARGYEKSLDFDFQGWRNGVLVIRHKDGTLFSALTGLAFDGPRKGERLRPIPTLVSDWGDWLKHYPQAVAYHMFDKYQPAELPAQLSADSVKSRGPADGRLPADTPVLGVSDGGKAVAYPLRFEGGSWLRLDGDRVILGYAPTKTAAAYRSVAEPPAKAQSKRRPVTLELAPSRVNGAIAPWRDRETGSSWDITGRAVAGELKGWTLPWLDGTQVKWFAWAAEYPQTSIAATQ